MPGLENNPRESAWLSMPPVPRPEMAKPGQPSPKPPRSFDLVTRGDLLARDYPPTGWLVPNLIPERSLVFFAGAPGSYKTFFALKAALASSCGGRVFDIRELQCEEHDAEVPKVPVLFFEEEMNGALVQDRIRKLNGGEDNLSFGLSQNVKLNSPEDLALLRETCLARGTKCVYLDPFSSVLGADDENDNAKVSKVLDDLRRALVDDPIVGCSVVLIHHPAKNADGRVASLRGAGDIFGKADHVVHFKFDEESRSVSLSVIKSRQADRMEIPVYTAAFRASYRDLEERIDCVLLASEKYGSKDDDGRDSKEEAVSRITGAFARIGAATQKEILDYLGESRGGTFKRAWSELSDAGRFAYNGFTKKFTLEAGPITEREVSRIYANSDDPAVPPVDKTLI